MEREFNPQKSAKLRCEGEVCGPVVPFFVAVWCGIIWPNHPRLIVLNYKHFYISWSPILAEHWDAHSCDVCSSRPLVSRSGRCRGAPVSSSWFRIADDADAKNTWRTGSPWNFPRNWGTFKQNSLDSPHRIPQVVLQLNAQALKVVNEQILPLSTENFASVEAPLKGDPLEIGRHNSIIGRQAILSHT